jgi:hypothetical protein
MRSIAGVADHSEPHMKRDLPANNLSLQIDRPAAEQFIALLTSSVDTPVTFHPIYGQRGVKPLREQHGGLEDRFDWLAECNRNQYGVFVMVNQGDGRGRKAENVTAVRALFVDCDKPDTEPLKLIASSAIDPDFIVESSPGKFHAYRRVSGFPVDRDLFKGAQLLLADRVQGDLTVHDLCRILRVPGFFHSKEKDGVWSDPFITRIREIAHEDRVTEYADLMEEYGWSEQMLRDRAAATKAKASTSGAVSVAAPLKPLKRDRSLPALLAEASTMQDGHGRNNWFMEVIGHLLGSGAHVDLVREQAEALRVVMLEPLPAETVRSMVERLSAKEVAKVATFPLTELGFAQRFAHRHGGEFRYVRGMAFWVAWDGRTWSKDDGAIRIQATAQELARGLLRDASYVADES